MRTMSNRKKVGDAHNRTDMCICIYNIIVTENMLLQDNGMR